MASRGARARKVTEKQIGKEEKKHAETDRAQRFARIHSPVYDTNITGRPFSPEAKRASAQQHGSSTHHAKQWNKPGTLQSSNASITSNGSNGSGFSGSYVSSSIASKLSSYDERKKYIAKGKATSHPRGRGGGVPMKANSIDQQRSKSSFSAFSESQNHYGNSRTHSMSSGPRHEAPANYGKSWDDTRLYAGAGHSPRPYSGFEHDEDMWMADGDCLIFFSEETDENDPRPMFRVHKAVLEQARSVFMTNLLRYGEIVPDEEDEEEQDTSPCGGPASPTAQWPLTPASLGNLDEMLSDGDPRNGPRPPDTPKYNPNRDTWSTSDQTIWQPGVGERTRVISGNATTPIGIAAPSLPESVQGDAAQDHGLTEITHEIWFRAPSHIKRPDIQRRHHMATRNYIALLYGLPIVGNSLYEMLSDLQNVMDTYYELNEPSERWNSAQVIVQYLTQHKLDDVRGNISNALGLLTWSEQSNVLWDAGYLEAFVHCVGMMTQATIKTKEYCNLSQVTRHKLQMAYNGVQLRLIEAEERLSRFDFPEMWYAEGVASNHLTQKSSESFREFLYMFYEEEYGRWPPTEEDHQGHWLSRSVMTRLQADFGAIYNYWVDRDVVWDGNESRATRKWEMIPKRPRTGGFDADAPGLPLTDMLIGFDSSQKYDHIPHPYPLLPEDRIPGPKIQSTRKNLLSKFRSKDKDHTPDVKQQYQMALAFNQASNINRLGTTFEDNKLLDALLTYEKSAAISFTSSSEARLGRWILLYGILQVLSMVSVDTAGLKHRDKLRYYVGPSLEGCPPWRSPDAAPLMIEACQQRSYCWLAPSTWNANGQATQGAGSPPGYSNHQYELTEPNLSNDVDSTPSNSIHRNPSILQTAMASGAGSRNGSVGRINHGVTSPTPGIAPVRSGLMNPTVVSTLTSPASDSKGNHHVLVDPEVDELDTIENMLRASTILSSLPQSNNSQESRRLSAVPNGRLAHRDVGPNGVGYNHTIADVDVVDEEADSNSGVDLASLRIDDRPPQLGELPFGDK